MVYCLLGQIQIWVGSVAFALCSDHSVLYVHACSCALVVYPRSGRFVLCRALGALEELGLLSRLSIGAMEK